VHSFCSSVTRGVGVLGMPPSVRQCQSCGAYVEVYWNDIKFSTDVNDVEKFLCHGDKFSPYNDILAYD
jgi:hypothetical protein